jgi:hypothetical protein
MSLRIINIYYQLYPDERAELLKVAEDMLNGIYHTQPRGLSQESRILLVKLIDGLVEADRKYHKENHAGLKE